MSDQILCSDSSDKIVDYKISSVVIHDWNANKWTHSFSFNRFQGTKIEISTFWLINVYLVHWSTLSLFSLMYYTIMTSWHHRFNFWLIRSNIICTLLLFHKRRFCQNSVFIEFIKILFSEPMIWFQSLKTLYPVHNVIKSQDKMDFLKILKIIYISTVNI